MCQSLWNGVLTFSIVNWPTFSWTVPLWCVRWMKYQYFWLCEAADHVIENQSGFHGKKMFSLGPLMVGIQFNVSILCGS